MTVKVLEGSPVFKVQATCGGCNAKLEATEVDLRIGHFDGDYTEAGPESLYFKCPVCEFDVRVKAPSSMLERVRRGPLVDE